MCLLQKDFEGKCQWLQSVPDRMARMSGHYICSTIKAAEVFATAVTVSVQLGLEQLGLLSRRRSYAKDAKRIQGVVATAQIPTSRQRKGETKRYAERAMERTVSTQSAERTNKGSRQRQRKGSRSQLSREHNDTSRAALDAFTEQCNQSCSIAAAYRATSNHRRRSHAQGTAVSLEEVFSRTRSRSQGDRPKVHTERRARSCSNALFSCGRPHHGQGGIGLCTTGQTQSSHQMEKLSDRCGCTVAKAYNRLSERRAGFVRTNRSSTTGPCTGCQEIRRVQDRTGRSSGSCGRRSCDERGFGQCGQECCGNGIARKSDDNVSSAAIPTGLSGGNGHRRGKLQQTSADGWRGWKNISCIRLWSARWIAVGYCACNAAICRPKEAFYPARQAVTEGYTCLGLDQHPLILKWTHRACNEPWFVPEWEAIERASELSWEFGIRSDRSFSTERLQQPTCGRGRQVHFSSDVELRFCGFSDPISASMKTTEQFIKQWPQKPWSLHLPKPNQNDCGNSLEPLSSGAVLIRKDHSLPAFAHFRTTDEFHNVPSTWFAQDNTNGLEQDEQDDELQHFLHEEPESIQILFDAFLR